MRRYNIYVKAPNIGKYELIKENPFPQGNYEEDYWGECFTWAELKDVFPYLRSRRWKIVIEPVEKEEVFDKIHLFSFTYGVNHDFHILNISGMRIIMSRDLGMAGINKEKFHPFGY